MIVLSNPMVTRQFDLNSILRDATICISGYFYVVDLGPEVQPRAHHVGKDKRCLCSLGADCPAVSAVAGHLRQGGERTPEPPADYHILAPETCPICGAPAYFEAKLSTRQHGAGWGCSKKGNSHYWQERSRFIAQALAANPWRFPPVVVRDGKQINAWDGILPTDQVLSPGLLRAEIGA
jgi:hypothetical protein